MTNLNCIRCGTLTTAGSQICNICDIELNPIRPSGARPFYQPGTGSRGTGSTTIRPFYGAGDVLGPTLVLFTKHFWLIMKLCIVIVAPFQIFKALSFGDIESDWQLAAGIYVLELLCSVLIAPALTYALMQAMQTGIAPGINESYRWGFSKLGKLTVSAVLSWIITALGFILCFIPGIVLTLALSLVFPIAILEKGSPWEALNGSLKLTKGHLLNILLAYIVIGLLLLLFSVPDLMGEHLAAIDSAFWPLQALGGICSAIVHEVTLVFSLVTYLSIRALWSQSSEG